MIIERKYQLISIVISMIILTILLPYGCTKSGGSRRSAADSLYQVVQNGKAKYDIKSPEKKYLLPYILEEISALSYYKDDILACVQDENGKVFFYNLVTEEIDHTTLFEYSGDYEGIEIVKDTVYIVKSNGDLFQLPVDFETEKRQATKFETPLKSKNDIEGLGYDSTTNDLLLVTKGTAGISGDKNKDSRGVYRFNLKEMKLDKIPVFIITEKERRNFYKKNLPENSYDDKRLLFKPSAIAVSPIDGNYYILASVGNIMLVVSPQGEILESYTIPPSLLTQPEGLCFAPDGTMYISSEGEGDRGYILKYSLIK